MIQEQSLGRHFIGSEIVSRSFSTALLNGGVTPTLLIETAGGLGEGGQWGGMIEIMKQRKGGNAEAESLKRSVSGEKGIGAKMVLPGKPRT